MLPPMAPNIREIAMRAMRLRNMLVSFFHYRAGPSAGLRRGRRLASVVEYSF
jgi:predicted nuclease with RNAse H fold